MSAACPTRADLEHSAEVPASMARYARQLPIEGIGVAGQERLLKATVLVAGVGGLGGTVATYLAAAGVGRMILTHHGPLELADLNRQTLMSPDWIGHSRLACARAALHRFNSDVRVTTVDRRLDHMDPVELEAWVAQADVVVSCRLNFEERDILNTACVTLNRPMVEAAMYGMEYTVTAILPGETPCLRCIHPAFPAWDAMGFPVLGAVPGVVGSLAAAEAVKLVTGAGRHLGGRLAYGDLGTMTFREFNLRRRPDCPVCAPAPTGRTLP